jgi:hypothetical protein
MNILKLFFLYSMFMISSCGNHEHTVPTIKDITEHDTTAVAVNESTLSTYFKTDEVVLDTLEHTIEVNIANSRLLQAKRKKMGTRWESPEPWVSVAATYQSRLLDKSIDSLSYNVSMDGEKSTYVYSVRQLQKSLTYVAYCENFATYLNSGNYSAIKKMLSADILDKHSDAQIRDFITSTFGDKHINRIELIGTKIVGTKYSFFIDFCYSLSVRQTYAFSFFEGDDKIGGLQVPK